MELYQSHAIKIKSRKYSKDLRVNHEKYLRVLESGKIGILALPFLTGILINFAYGQDLDLEGKLLTGIVIVAVNGTRIVGNTEKEKKNLQSERIKILRKIEINKEFDLTYGVVDL